MRVWLRTTAAAAAAAAAVLVAIAAATTSVATVSVRTGQANAASGSHSVIVHGRVQTCRVWSYTALSGTRCRTSPSYPAARLRIALVDGATVVDYELRTSSKKTWSRGPYRYNAANKTAMLDGTKTRARAPKVGVAKREWVDKCAYWLFSRSGVTTCQRGSTVALTVRRTASNGATVLAPNGSYRPLRAYTWRPTGSGYYALDASLLPRPAEHPISVPPPQTTQSPTPTLPTSPTAPTPQPPPPPPPTALLTWPPGPARTGLPADFAIFDSVAEPSNPNQYHSYCSSRLITVHVDYTGAAAAATRTLRPATRSPMR
jgi:hypothetical protein